MQTLNPAYVYLIKHIPTGKFYYGSRYNHIKLGLAPSEDLWIEYFTSSKEVKYLLKESPLTDFMVNILFTSHDHDLCFEYEQTLIKENIDNVLCLNKRYFDSKKGSRVFRTYGKTLSSKGKTKSESTRLRMSKPKSKSHRENISKAQLTNGGNGPKAHSEETKNKIRRTLQLSPRPDKVCPYCNKSGGFLSMSRWHFDNCKEKNV
jgi:hypothetical protein